MEQKIIEAAKVTFLKKGFKETNMSDIAAEVGLIRPAMHYYFRTKERLFQAVFGDILMSFLPKVSDIITSDAPLEEKIGSITDVPYEGGYEGFRRIRADCIGNQHQSGRK